MYFGVSATHFPVFPFSSLVRCLCNQSNVCTSRFAPRSFSEWCNCTYKNCNLSFVLSNKNAKKILKIIKTSATILLFICNFCIVRAEISCKGFCTHLLSFNLYCWLTVLTVSWAWAMNFAMLSTIDSDGSALFSENITLITNNNKNTQTK